MIFRVLIHVPPSTSIFLPPVIRDRNSLSCADRNVNTIDSFKRHKSAQSNCYEVFFTVETKNFKFCIPDRLGCSSLNHDLFLKNIVESPLCRFGDFENTEHFFIRCRLYSVQRVELLRQVSEYCTVTLDTLLKGNSLLSIESNQDMF